MRAQAPAAQNGHSELDRGDHRKRYGNRSFGPAERHVAGALSLHLVEEPLRGCSARGRPRPLLAPPLPAPHAARERPSAAGHAVHPRVAARPGRRAGIRAVPLPEPSALTPPKPPEGGRHQQPREDRGRARARLHRGEIDDSGKFVGRKLQRATRNLPGSYPGATQKPGVRTIARCARGRRQLGMATGSRIADTTVNATETDHLGPTGPPVATASCRRRRLLL